MKKLKAFRPLDRHVSNRVSRESTALTCKPVSRSNVARHDVRQYSGHAVASVIWHWEFLASDPASSDHSYACSSVSTYGESCKLDHRDNTCGSSRLTARMWPNHDRLRHYGRLSWPVSRGSISG